MEQATLAATSKALASAYPVVRPERRVVVPREQMQIPSAPERFQVQMQRFLPTVQMRPQGGVPRMAMPLREAQGYAYSPQGGLQALPRMAVSMRAPQGYSEYAGVPAGGMPAVQPMPVAQGYGGYAGTGQPMQAFGGPLGGSGGEGGAMFESASAVAAARAAAQ